MNLWAEAEKHASQHAAKHGKTHKLYAIEYPKLLSNNDQMLSVHIIDQLWLHYRLNDPDFALNHPEQDNESLLARVDKTLNPNKYAIVYNEWLEYFRDFVSVPGTAILSCIFNQRDVDCYIIAKKGKRFSSVLRKIDSKKIDQLNDMFLEKQCFGKWCIIEIYKV